MRLLLHHMRLQHRLKLSFILSVNKKVSSLAKCHCAVQRCCVASAHSDSNSVAASSIPRKKRENKNNLAAEAISSAPKFIAEVSIAQLQQQQIQIPRQTRAAHYKTLGFARNPEETYTSSDGSLRLAPLLEEVKKSYLEQARDFDDSPSLTAETEDTQRRSRQACLGILKHFLKKLNESLKNADQFYVSSLISRDSNCIIVLFWYMDELIVRFVYLGSWPRRQVKYQSDYIEKADLLTVKTWDKLEKYLLDLVELSLAKKSPTSERQNALNRDVFGVTHKFDKVSNAELNRKQAIFVSWSKRTIKICATAVVLLMIISLSLSRVSRKSMEADKIDTIEIDFKDNDEQKTELTA